MSENWKLRLTGVGGGLVNGLFGGGGGMAVVPLLTRWCGLEEKKAFATCVAIIFPFCVLSAAIYLFRTGFDLLTALPYLAGGLAGGLVGGLRSSTNVILNGKLRGILAASYLPQK